MRKQLIFFFSLILNYTVLFSQTTYSEKGIASFYADKFEGRKTASGEIFRNSGMTAAHKTLKFGTLLRVTNLNNQKSIVVRVNDRGPYAHGRIIDLTKEAASKLSMLQKGLCEVLIEEIITEKDVENNETVANDVNDETEVISIWGTKRKAPLFGVQLASFEDEQSALSFAKEAYEKGVELPLIKVFKDESGTYYRVMAGDYNTDEEARRYIGKLKKIGYKGFVKTY